MHIWLEKNNRGTSSTTSTSYPKRLSPQLFYLFNVSHSARVLVQTSKFAIQGGCQLPQIYISFTSSYCVRCASKLKNSNFLQTCGPATTNSPEYHCGRV